MSLISNEDLKDIVDISNGVQRNFDLNVDIPAEDLDTLIHVASHCPSKNGVAFYQLHVITDKDLISSLHNISYGTRTLKSKDWATNSQTLSNVLFVYEEITEEDFSPKARRKFIENTDARIDHYTITEKSIEKEFLRDVHMSIGIASGYVDLAANLMGYKTGFCRCYDEEAASEVMVTKGKIQLLQGIGIPDPNLDRRQHAITKDYFPLVPKEPIKIIRW